jgi:hypothetical protein
MENKKGRGRIDQERGMQYIWAWPTGSGKCALRPSYLEVFCVPRKSQLGIADPEREIRRMLLQYWKCMGLPRHGLKADDEPLANLPGAAY